jgi:hypothetical protein
MGGQGRFAFNFPGNRAQMLKDGGRAKARGRYEHPPSCSCPDCRKERADGGRSGRAPGEPSAEELYGSKRDWRKVGDAVFGPRPAKPPKPKPEGKATGGKAGRQDGGPVEFSGAGSKRRAKGGEAYDIPAWDKFNNDLEKRALRDTYGKRTTAQLLQRHAKLSQKPGPDAHHLPIIEGVLADRGVGGSDRAGRAKGGPLDFGKNEAAYQQKRQAQRAELETRRAESERRPFSLVSNKKTVGEPVARARGGPTIKKTFHTEDGYKLHELGNGQIVDHPNPARRDLSWPSHEAFADDNGYDLRAKGDRTAHARGGKAGKGKTNINIVIAPGGMNPQAAAPPQPAGLPPGGPMRPPGMPMPMPPPPGAAAGAPAAMPMPIPIPGPAGPPGPPPGGPRARGGRAPKAGAGSGLGRLQKAAAAARKDT